MALLPGSRSPCPAVQSPLCARPGGLNPTPALSRSRADQQEPRCHNQRLSTRRLRPVPVTAGSSRLPNGPVHRRTNQGSTWPLWTNQRCLRLLCGATVRKGGKCCERRAVEGRAGGSSSDSFQPSPRPARETLYIFHRVPREPRWVYTAECDTDAPPQRIWSALPVNCPASLGLHGSRSQLKGSE